MFFSCRLLLLCELESGVWVDHRINTVTSSVYGHIYEWMTLKSELYLFKMTQKSESLPVQPDAVTGDSQHVTLSCRDLMKCKQPQEGWCMKAPTGLAARALLQPGTPTARTGHRSSVAAPSPAPTWQHADRYLESGLGDTHTHRHTHTHTQHSA